MYKVCGVSVSHKFEGHIHETPGHKTTTSSEHELEREEQDEDQELKPEKTRMSYV